MVALQTQTISQRNETEDTTPHTDAKIETEQKPKDVSEYLKFPFKREQDTTHIFEGAERSADVLYKIVAENGNAKEMMQMALSKVAALYESTDMKPYLEKPSLANYLRIIEKLDDLIAADVSLPAEKKDNAYTNGTAAVARHMFSVAYVQQCINSAPGKTLNDVDVLSIAVADTMMMQNEMQIFSQGFKEKGHGNKDRVVVEALSFNINNIASIGTKWFKSPDKKTNDALETVIASMALYYADRSEINKDNSRMLSTHKNKLNENYNPMIIGLRSEVLSFGYLDALATELNDVLASPTVVDAKNSPELASAVSFIDVIKNDFLEKDFVPKKFAVIHAPAEIDKAGIADMALCVDIQKPGQPVQRVGLLLIEVKTEYMDAENFILVSGLYPEKAKSGAVNIKELEGDELKKPTPEASHAFVKENGVAILSIRFPQAVVSGASRTGSKEVAVAVGGRSQLKPIKDMNKLVNPEDTDAKEKASIDHATLFYTMKSLVKNVSTFRNSYTRR